MPRGSVLLPFDDDFDVPGTDALVDRDHAHSGSREGTDIVLIPAPTTCEGDPLNWSKWKKYWHLFLISTYACVFSFAENNTGDAWTTIVDMTGSTMSVMNGGGALNYLLLGVVNIFWIPTAMKIGRRFCFLLTLVFCIGASVWMGAFHTVGEWYGSNIVNGLGTSAYEAVIQLVIFDLFFDHQRGQTLGIYIFAQQLGSTIGLMTGGYIADGPGWRWAQWVVAIAEGLLLVIFFFLFEETRFPRFLFSRNELPTDNDNKSKVVTEPVSSDDKADDEDHQAVPLEKKLPTVSESASVSEGVTSSPIPSPAEFPKRTYWETLRLWYYWPQDKTTYWAYFKRPFFLLAFPNVVIVSIPIPYSINSSIPKKKKRRTIS